MGTGFAACRVLPRNERVSEDLLHFVGYLSGVNPVG